MPVRRIRCGAEADLVHHADPVLCDAVCVTFADRTPEPERSSRAWKGFLTAVANGPLEFVIFCIGFSLEVSSPELHELLCVIQSAAYSAAVSHLNVF